MSGRQGDGDNISFTQRYDYMELNKNGQQQQQPSPPITPMKTANAPPPHYPSPYVNAFPSLPTEALPIQISYEPGDFSKNLECSKKCSNIEKKILRFALTLIMFIVSCVITGYSVYEGAHFKNPEKVKLNTDVATYLPIIITVTSTIISGALFGHSIKTLKSQKTRNDGREESRRTDQ